MAKEDKADVTVISEKGQVVIPQSLRQKLGLKPKTKLLVYGYNDAVIMKKMQIPDVRKELQEIYRKVEQRIANHGELTEEEITQLVQKYRHGKYQGP